MGGSGEVKNPILALTWRTLAVALVILLVATTSSEASRRDRSRTTGRTGSARFRLRRCQRPPRFSVDGVEPMQEFRGKVTLVALLTNTCSFCIQQSRALAILDDQLNSHGQHVLNMMIVDAGPPPRRVENGVFERIVNFSVYHDDRNNTIWRQVFRGNKDDILIFNECGMLTYHLRFPYSYLGYSLVRNAISNTADHDICPRCLRDGDRQPPQERMQGDAPMPGRTRVFKPYGSRGVGDIMHGYNSGFSGTRRGMRGSSLLGNHRRSRCPRNDRFCQELRRERRRYNRLLASHRLSSQMNEEQILEMLGRFEHPRGRVSGAH